MKFDLHCHTKAGSIDAKVPLSRYIELLKAQGFSGMLVTDHDSYKGYRQWKEEENSVPDFVVLEGVEYDTKDAGHILVILPDGIQLDVLQVRGLKLETLIDLVHHFGGILGPSHPFGSKSSSLMHFRKIRRFPHLLKEFDFIEGFNACDNHASNYLAQKMAEFLNKPCTGGSDSHSEDCVGSAFTDFDAEITCNNDLIEAILRRRIIETGGTERSDSLRSRIKNHTIPVWLFRTYNRLVGISLTLRRRSRLSQLPIRLPHSSKDGEEECSAETL